MLDAIDDAITDITCPLVGVSAADVYVPGFNFLFGLSYTGRGAALVALARLIDDTEGTNAPRVLAKRAGKIAIHELGHAIGLPHCRERHCVMRYSDSVSALDSESGRFSPRCRARLRELRLRAD